MEDSLVYSKSTNLNVNPIPKYPRRSTQNKVWPNIWASHGLRKLTHTINHLRCTHCWVGTSLNHTYLQIEMITKLYIHKTQGSYPAYNLKCAVSPGKGSKVLKWCLLFSVTSYKLNTMIYSQYFLCYIMYLCTQIQT